MVKCLIFVPYFVETMERGRDEDNENILQDMIHENEGNDDVSSFLNLEELDRRDGSGDDEIEGEADGSGAGTISTTKFGEVY